MAPKALDAPSPRAASPEADAQSPSADRYQRVLQGVNRILTQAIRADSEEALGNTCLDVALEVTDSAFGFLGEVGDDGLLRSIAISVRGERPDRAIRVGHRDPQNAQALCELYSPVLTQGANLLVNSPSSLLASIGMPPGHPPLTAFLGVPLWHEGQSIAVLGVANREGGYGPEQQEDLEALAPTVVECLYRRRAEEALRQSEARYRRLFEAAPFGIGLSTLSGEALGGNAAMQRIFGFTPEELDASRMREIYVDAGDREVMLEELQRDGHVRGHEVPFWRKDGSVCHAQLSVELISLPGREEQVLMTCVQDVTERVQAEEALRHGEALYRALAENLPGGAAFVLDRDLRYVVAAGQALESGGLASDAFVGRTIWEVLDAETAASREPFLRQALAGEPFEHEHEVADRHFISRGVPIRDAEGNVTHALAISYDITDRVQAEEALRESEERYRSLFENMSEGFFLAEFLYDQAGKPVDYRLLDANQAYESLTGLKREDGIGRTVREILPKDGELWIKAFAPAVVTGAPVRVESYSDTLDQYYEVYAYPVGGDRFAGLFLDVTERRRAEAALRASEAAAREQLAEIDSIYRSAPVGLCVFDDQLRYVRINERMAEINGVPAAEHLGKTPREVVPDLADLAEALLRRILDTGEAELNVEFTGTTPSQPGVQRTWIEQWLPIKDAEGRVVAVNAVADEITDRVRAEAALQRSEERFRLLSKTASHLLSAEDPLAVVNELCQGVMAHLDCQAFFNYVVDEHERRLHLNACAGIPEEVAAEIAWLDYGVAVCGTVARDGVRIVVDEVQTSDDPRTCLVASYGIRAYACHPLLSQGEVIGTLSFGTRTRDRFSAEDLALMKTVADQVAVAMERVRAQAALRLAYERTAAILESISDSFITVDRQWRFVYANRRALAYSGREPADVIGKTIWEVFPAIVGTPLELFYRQAMASSEPLTLRNLSSVAMGKMFELRAYPADDGLSIFGQDITDRVQAEAALREIEEQRAISKAVSEERQRLYDVLETLPAMVCLLTTDHHISFANRSYQERYGDLGDRRCFEHLHGRSEPCLDCETFTALETGKPRHWESVSADGRVIESHAFPFRDADGTQMVLEMSTDITERRRAQEALVQAERMAVLGRMAATLAHEVNNPLQAVVGCLGLAIEVLPENEVADRYLNVAMEELKRAGRIVQRIRDLGREQEGQREPADVGELIERVVVLTEDRALVQGVQVAWEDDGRLPLVPLLRDRIQQVFLNLVLNAIDAMPNGGELRITAARTAGPLGVQIAFTDTGDGILPEELERIFEAFYTTKPEELGLGLGLYVSRGIVEEHGGRIDVKSEPGRGATFTVWLPSE